MFDAKSTAPKPAPQTPPQKPVKQFDDWAAI